MSRVYIALIAALLSWTAAQASPSVLLYVPLHIKESVDQLQSFLDCTLLGDNGDLGTEVDFLLITSGEEPHPQEDQVKDIVEGLSSLQDVRQAAFRHFTLDKDVYDRERTSADWVKGPNTAFYSVFRQDGAFYEEFAARYDFVQQLEVDVCALRPNWVPALLRAFEHDQNVIMSGSSIKGNCAYDDANHACLPHETLPDYIQRHINGNAMFRIGDPLQQLMEEATARYADWPFDLALWLAANATGTDHVLYDTPAVVNVPFPIDAKLCFDPRLYGEEAVLAHVTSGNRADPIDAGLATLNRSLPATLTFVSASHVKFLNLMLRQTEELGLQNVVVFVFSTDLFFKLREMHPHTSFVRVAGVSSEGSTEYRSAAYDAVVNLKTQLAYDVLLRGFSVFCVDADVYVQHDYEPYISSLSTETVYFSSESVAATGLTFPGQEPRYYFNAGVYLIPHAPGPMSFVEHWIARQKETGEDEQQLLNQILKCTTVSDCTWSSVPVAPLPEDLFQNGNNAFARVWPNPEAAERAFIIHNNWADGLGPKLYRFKMRHMIQPGSRVSCKAASQFPEALAILTPATAGPTVVKLIGFFKSLREKEVPCAIVPNLTIAGTDWVFPFETIFNYNAAAELAGARFFPHHEFVESDSWVDYDPLAVTKEDIDPELFEISYFKPLLHMFVHDVFTQPFTCVADHLRTLEEVAVRTYRNEIPFLYQVLAAKLQENTQVLLAGKWRVVASKISSLDARVITTGLTHLPPHLYATFGLPFIHGELGVGIFHDILEALVCEYATERVQLVDMAGWLTMFSTQDTLMSVMQHIPMDILEEDLQVLEDHPEVLHSLRSRRHLLALELTVDNGLSNVENAIQTMAYFANQSGSAAFMLPLSETHVEYVPSPWSAVADMDKFYSAFPYVLPASLAVMMYPSLLLYAGDYQVPVVPEANAEGTAAVFAKHNSLMQGLLDLIDDGESRVFTLPATWTISEGTAEALRMTGSFATTPSHPYLGLNDEEVEAGLRMFPLRSPVLLRRAFRRMNFQVSEPPHVEFAHQWLGAFTYSDRVLAIADRVSQQLGEEYDCVHLRTKQEYFDTQDPEQPHASAEGVYGAALEWLEQRAESIGRPVYVAQDVPSESFGTRLHAMSSVKAVFSLPETCGDVSVVCALVDKSVCANAQSFVGSIYSSFSLSVCGKRGDPLCVDLYGRSLGDGRLVF